MTHPPRDGRWIRVGVDPDAGTRTDDSPFTGLTGHLPGADAARPLAEAVEEAALWGPGPLRILVETPLCLASTVSAAGLPPRGAARRLRSLAYRLEERLPVEIEALEVGFGPLPERSADDADDADVVALAVERAWLGPLRLALGSLGPLQVEAAGLAAARTVLGSLGATGPAAGWLWLPPGSGGPAAEVLAFEEEAGGRRPLSWSGLSAAGDAPGGLRERLRDANVPALVVAGAGAAADDAAASAEALGGTVFRVADPAAVEPAAGAAWATLQPVEPDDARAWRSPAVWQPWAVGVAVALLLLATGLGIRGLRADAAAEAARRSQDAVFRRVAPGLPMPASVPAKLRSLIAAQALRGDGAPGDGAVGQHFREVLSVLAAADAPASRVERLRFEAGAVSLQGETRSVADAERLAEGLGEAMPGWAFRVEQTTRVGDHTEAVWLGAPEGDLP